MLSTLNEARGYDHIVVGPHLDDAVLSMGGQIALLAGGGARVLAVTLCAGHPPRGAELSPFAQYLHREWALGDEPMSRRRDEDVAALQLLGCDGLQLEQLDAPYRVAAYGVGDGWRGAVAADDPLAPAAADILALLHAQQPAACIYVPLGVGNHVDHQIVCAAALDLARQGVLVRWYEDVPYAAKAPHSLAERLQQLAVPFEPVIVAIDAVLEQKLQAIALYRSQQRELFGTADMRQVMTEYAAAVSDRPGGFAERLWHRPER